jgi:hypothetical protein
MLGKNKGVAREGHARGPVNQKRSLKDMATFLGWF